MSTTTGPGGDREAQVRAIEQEFAVVVAALLAGRIDGQQAVASLLAVLRKSSEPLGGGLGHTSTSPVSAGEVAAGEVGNQERGTP